MLLVVLLLSESPTFRQEQAKLHYRTEPRTWAQVAVELSTLKGADIHETTVTENVSHYGACALTKNRWVPDAIARVRFLYEGVSVQARVAYCHPSGEAFAVGLQFSTAIDLWIPPTIWLGHRKH